MQLGGGRTLHPHLLLGDGGAEAGGVPGDEEGGDAAGAVDTGAGQDRVEVGDAAVRDPRLGTGDDPVLTVPYGLGAQRGGIGARGGLREAVGAQQAASEHRREVFGLLVLGAVAGDRVAGEGMDADAEPDGEPGGAELFECLEVDLVRLVPAAVGGVVGQAQESGLGEQGEDVARETARVLLLCGPRHDLPLGDVADERDELPGLVGGQTAFHQLRGTVGHDGALLPVGRCGGHARGV